MELCPFAKGVLCSVSRIDPDSTTVMVERIRFVVLTVAFAWRDNVACVLHIVFVPGASRSQWMEYVRPQRPRRYPDSVLIDVLLEVRAWEQGINSEPEVALRKSMPPATQKESTLRTRTAISQSRRNHKVP